MSMGPRRKGEWSLGQSLCAQVTPREWSCENPRTSEPSMAPRLSGAPSDLGDLDQSQECRVKVAPRTKQVYQMSLCKLSLNRATYDNKPLCLRIFCFSLNWSVICVIQIIRLIMHWGTQVPDVRVNASRCQDLTGRGEGRGVPKINPWQVTVTDGLTSTGRFPICG